MEIYALIWGGIIAFGVIMYVLLGGFDLGIGIMSLFIRNPHHRDLMISSILPVWDGNQTWLVFGGAALYGAFPLAFSTILPIMYIPILIMVIALLFRGIAFEFRLKAIKTKYFWDICFCFGSLFATIAQGLILGTFVSGFDLEQTTCQWLKPFGIACAISLIFGYTLLGSNFLLIKTSGELQQSFFAISKKLQYVILASFVMVSVWSPFLHPDIMHRWFNLQYMPYFAILPMLTLILFFYHWQAIKNKNEKMPFWSAIGMFLLCYFGFIVSVYPYVVPRKITYIQAAAGESSLLFMLVGAGIMLPPLLYYTHYAYKIFRGKIVEKIGY